MEPQEIIDLGRDAIKTCLVIGGPILLASLIIGLLVGMFQAMTQVPDQSVAFVPKLVCLILVLGIALPWLTDRMLDYSHEAFATPHTLKLRSDVPVGSPWLQRAAHRDGDPSSNQPGAREQESQTPSKGESQPQPDRNQPSQPPFQLPSYRFSRVSTENRSG